MPYCQKHLSSGTCRQGEGDEITVSSPDFLDAKAFRAQIIRHQEEHVFSIAQLRFQFDNQIEEAFVMANRVTEKFLWKNRNKSRALLITRSKCKLKEKMQKNVGEGTLRSGSASVAPPGALNIESGQKTGKTTI